MNSHEIRTRFIEYFKKNGHTHVPSSRLVPDNDPTLLFTNSGMVQFKNVFLGLEKKPYTRATTAQKCLRAGGKHNDLENVGFTGRHHTYFEMLGNFSFGDYFKKEAIKLAWQFLTEDLKIDKKRLSVTVFKTDDEAFNLWRDDQKIPTEKIFRFGEKDNFWQMGDTGPCGPCSEIFYDHGPKYGCGKPTCNVGCECDRFVEIWNLVFMQFNKDSSGKLDPLPKPSVDTGMGLERLCAVLQGVNSNYETDLFTDLFSVMENLSGHKFDNSTSEKTTAMKVVADHCRASAFLIADGILPSNEGQGYVLRRIMRRGIRYGRKLSNKSVFVPTVTEVIQKMGKFYTELTARKDFILSTVEAEESRFNQTLDQGTSILNEALKEAKSKNLKAIAGETVFKLYDTFGFPLDLTELMAKEAGFVVDQAGFEKLMDAQKTRARASWKGNVTDQLREVLTKSAQSLAKTNFKGFDSFQCDAQVLATFSNTKNEKSLKGVGVLVFDQTPFYAESGGQVGDSGIGKVGASKFEISDTQKISDVYFHYCDTGDLTIKVGDKINLSLTEERKSTMRNHSATHLLHSALRKVLGDHVTQAGSLVDAQRLRFDFTQPKALASADIKAVEDLVNKEVGEGRPVGSAVMPYQKAIQTGAMALFGEKYSDDVRVISMGEFSKELCGGTHVKNTSDIRIFKITSESGVSSGVRRIEAITGDLALNYLLDRHSDLRKVELELKAEEGKALERILKLQENQKKLERDLKKSLTAGQSVSVDELVSGAKNVGAIKVVSSCVSIEDREMLSSLSDKIKDKIKTGVIVLIGQGVEKGPCPIVVMVTKDLVGKYHAGNLLKEVAQVMGGKGGGRPDFAQGAGPLSEKAQEASEKTFELVH